MQKNERFVRFDVQIFSHIRVSRYIIFKPFSFVSSFRLACLRFIVIIILFYFYFYTLFIYSLYHSVPFLVCKLLFDGQRISFRCFIPIFFSFSCCWYFYSFSLASFSQELIYCFFFFLSVFQNHKMYIKTPFQILYVYVLE